MRSNNSEIILNDLRVQALSKSLIRIEKKGPKGFEDRPTFHVVNRNWEGCNISQTDTDSQIHLVIGSHRVSIPKIKSGLNDIQVSNKKNETIWESSSLELEYFTITNRLTN